MSYGILTYVSAWLKVNYPLQFMANLITNAYESGKDARRIEEMVQECQRIGIRFLPVDANKSDWRFTVEDGKLRIGLCAIKAFGDIAAEELMSIRPIESFDSVIAHFCEKGAKLNKKCLTVLIFIDAFRNLGIEKPQMLYKMVEAKASKKAIKEGIRLPEDGFTVCAGCTLDLEDDEDEIERKLLKVNYLHRPGADLAPIGFNSKDEGARFSGVVRITDVMRKTDRRGQEMAFLKLAAGDCQMRGVVFGSVYSKIDPLDIRKGKNVSISAKKDKEDSCIIYTLEAA